MYHKTELTNGLRIVTHSMKERDSVSLGFWVGTGGRYEEDRVKGAAHFLEHILFKGSQGYSCDAIKEQIEGVGGSLNAFTAEEQTCFYAKIPAKYLKKTLSILGDMVFHPLIKKRDVDQEKAVIIEELKMYHDLPQYFVIEMLDSMIWPDHPLGKHLAGTPESVMNMSHQDLRQFHKDYYGSRNIVVSACGQVDHQVFTRIVRQKFKKITAGAIPDFIQADNIQMEPQVKFYRKNIEQMHLALGTLGVPDGHKDKYVLCLLHVILGGNMSSRLFDEVREKRGLAYSISSSMKSLKDTGYFLIRAGVDNKKIVEAVDVILQELRKIRRHGVSRDEFTRAKDFYLGQVLLGLEDTLDHMLWIGESVLSRNRVKTLADVVQRVKKVKIDDIQRVANELINDRHYNLAIVGPLANPQEKSLRGLIGV